MRQTRCWLRVEAELGEQRVEDVLPDRVARAGVVEADAAASSPRAAAPQVVEVVRRDDLPRPAGGERRAARELLERQLAGHREVVVAGEADAQCSRGQRDAGVGVGAVADEVAEAPDLVGAARRAASSSTASKACRLPWMSETTATHARTVGAPWIVPERLRDRRSRSPPPWWSRRRPCCSCGRATG